MRLRTVGRKINRGWLGPVDRFWGQVNKIGPIHPIWGRCWIWTGATSGKGYRVGKGYGRILVNGRYLGSHRFSWIINQGAIPDGYRVLHKCDNPRCVNPDHLFLGTESDNRRDAVAKGRAYLPTGEDHGQSKVSERDARYIKSRYIKGFKYKPGNVKILADKFGITETQVRNIATGRSWKKL